MADYKELLRRAIKALPENNGAARRAVYEKARSALVAQLRAINPPLPPKDITQHRLQLEDCIRQVEQETSEALLSRSMDESQARNSVQIPPAQSDAPDSQLPREAEAPRPYPSEVTNPPQPNPGHRSQPEAGSIADIIAEAERAAHPASSLPQSASVASAEPAESKAAPAKPDSRPAGGKPEPARTGGRPLPSIVARAEAARATPVIASPEPRGRGGSAAAVAVARPEPAGRKAVARQPAAESAPVASGAVMPALSSVREVELEPPLGEVREAEGAIDRAIAALDREARGEPGQPSDAAGAANGPIVLPTKGGDRQAALENAFRVPAKPDAPPGRGRAEGQDRSGGNALAIFLVMFFVLLAGAGGAGYWAWNEGYLNLSALFGSGQQVADSTNAAGDSGTPPEPSPAANEEATVASGPGNTESAVPTVEPTVALSSDDRLPPTIDPGTDTEVASAPVQSDGPLALVEPSPGSTLTVGPSTDEIKTEERLPGSDAAVAAAPDSALAATDPAALAGTQSLLLEATDNGTTGAVPFSGTVEWSKGVDETGQPTLIGKANIPARNLGVEVLIRRNTDPILPASHLMEIDFSVSETFIGGSIAGLPGVLLKNEELVQGTPLVGASARVVGNSFLFALSASPEDSATNNTLLTTRKWIDLAVIYATGKRAIITLEKDDAAQAMFTEVFAAWEQQAAASAE